MNQPGSLWARRVVGVTLVVLLSGQMTSADDSKLAALGREYEQEIRTLTRQYCRECHGNKRAEGEINFEAMSTLAEVRKQTKVWQKAHEALESGQMPPKEARQPQAVERAKLQDWVHRYLTLEAEATAGDPGPVVLRRLSNAEYTYTIRDLTGVDLDPAREFPADSAAGEGFTNAGNALVMSPALLTKYLDAGKEIARHAVLLPDGFRFSPSTTQSDWTNDTLARIREFYRGFTDTGGATQVNLQGIVFDTNQGGRLPVEKYLAATIAEREALTARKKTIAVVAAERGLNAKYLGLLWNALNDREPSLLLDVLRDRWRTAKPEQAGALAAEVNRWQQTLWRFTKVGHIGKVNGPKAWQEPVTPLVARQDVRVKLSPTPDQMDVTLYLAAGDAGDGNEGDFVVWHQPRLVSPGRPDLLLRDVRDFVREMTARREQTFASTTKALRAAAEVAKSIELTDLAAVAKQQDVDLDVLNAWLDYLGIGGGTAFKLDHFTNKLTSAANYEFIRGWGSHQTPLLLANASDQLVRVPGNMKPHGVCVHPSPTLAAAVGWQSPIAGQVKVEGIVTHAHVGCGNGVTWSLELRRGATRQQLISGIAQGNKNGVIGPIDTLAVRQGDLLSLVIGPREGNHSCDLTDLELVIRGGGEKPQEWNLSRDLSVDVLAGNPHADQYGNNNVWHFYTEPIKAGEQGTIVPAGSLVARWHATEQPAEKERLAKSLEQLLVGGPSAGADDKEPDVLLYRQLSSLGGPLLMRAWPHVAATLGENAKASAPQKSDLGLDPARFGKHPGGQAIEATSLCVQAPSVNEVRLPADLVSGAEFVTTGTLHPTTGVEGSVQLHVSTTKAETTTGLIASAVTESNAGGQWTGNNQRTAFASPVVVNDGSAARKRFEAAFDRFRELFPVALCYTKIVPVDEVVTLTLFYREDGPLARLVLDEAQTAQLNRLWDELRFISQDSLTLVDALEQLIEYATQDADPKVFTPLRKPFAERAEAFRRALVAAELKQVDALIEFAGRAYRRPLTPGEVRELRGLYQSLRDQELPHDEAFQFTLARVFVAPAFLYRLETAPAGTKPGPVSDWELASRLSYFLWSSQPDEELRAAAAAGTLHQPEVLTKQAKRMLTDERVRRLATEFACQWLHIYDFDRLDEKSERHFPDFVDLRGDMYEESIRFFADLFQRDGSLLTILDADHTFVNERLAKFYGLPADATAAASSTADNWRRVDGIKQSGRGGILGLSTTLAKQSGASRTSPILRGNWISEVLLGEKLPKPPKDVPQLPEDETATEGLTVRQLIEKHSSDPRCSTCHQRMDPFGFALEGFDAIGRRREKDLGSRPIDTHSRLPDGTEIDGLSGLRNYLLTTRRDAIVRQFCRKLLGYALGRGVQLSDEPLLADMQKQLSQHDYHFSVAIEAIIHSPQFREIRGRNVVIAESP